MKNNFKAFMLLFVAVVVLLVPHFSRAAQTNRNIETGETGDAPTVSANEAIDSREVQEKAITAVDTRKTTVPPEHSWYELVEMFPGAFFLKGEGNGKKIALTFDDGPDDLYTPLVLDVLMEHKVPATFFLIGGRSQAYADVVERIVAEGHIIANHTWTHPRMTELSGREIIAEMAQTEAVLAQITGKHTALMRPPYGAISREVLQELGTLGYVAVNWTADSVDWRDQSAEQILANILPDVNAGGILLFHSAGGAGNGRAATVEALPLLIEILKEQGYVFVTVDELLNIPAYR